MPPSSLITGLLPLAGLLLASAFFSGTETAFFSLDSVKKRRLSARAESSRRAGTVLRLLGDGKSRLLNTILLGNTVVNVAAAAVAARLMERLIPGESGLAVSMIVMTFLVLVVGEIAPKTWAFGNNLSWALRSAPVIDLVVTVMRPVTTLLSLVSRAAGAVSGASAAERSMEGTELISLVELGRAEGLLGAEAAVTASLLSLDRRQCREAMVPRSGASVVRTDWSRARVIEFLRSSSYSRFPVLHGPEETVLGYLDAAEVLIEDHRHRLHRGHGRPGGGDDEEEPPGIVIHDMLFFPENAPLDVVLAGLRSSGEKMGAVVDEYGDWVGIITLSDILTLAVFQGLRRVGDLPDGVSRRGASYVVPASINLGVLSTLLGVELSAEHAESCGGLLEEVTGRVPATGERILHSGVHFLVLTSDGRRLGRVEVRRVPGASTRSTGARSDRPSPPGGGG